MRRCGVKDRLRCSALLQSSCLALHPHRTPLALTVISLHEASKEITCSYTGVELTDRILAILDEKKDTTPSRKEEIASCIDCAFRNIKKKKRVMHKPETVQAIAEVPEKRADFDTMVQKKEGQRFRCICGSSLPLDPIIQCDDPGCRIWQHAGCVIVPDPVDRKFNIPTRFLCEICRIQRADPFWMTMAYPLHPVKLVPSLVASDGSRPALSMEKTFVLSNVHMKLLLSTEHELQAWSMLVNDNVQFRMQWPLDSNFHINGTNVRVLNRPSSQLLGTNSRDDGPLIKTYCKEGLNQIALSWNDSRTFCFGIRIAKRRKISQVVNMILNNIENQESLQDALARICHCVGGNGVRSRSVDSDFEVVDDRVTINLRFPLSGSRIKVAARFKQCVHMGCFDLYTFVHLSLQSRKWQCPVCLKNYSLEDLVIDPFFTKITSMLSMLDEELTEVEVNSDGLWRLKAKDGLNGPESPWCYPNDFIYDPNINPNLNLSQIKPSVSKPDKYEHSLIPISNEGLLTKDNQSEENPKYNQCNPNFIGSLCTLISPPCMEMGNALQDGRNADLRTLCNASSYQQSVSTKVLSGDMSMQGVTHHDDWIPFSLAVGIVHPVPAPIIESVSSVHNLSAMSSFGLPPDSDATPELEMLMNYNIFSRPVTPEFFHITDPKFQL